MAGFILGSMLVLAFAPFAQGWLALPVLAVFFLVLRIARNGGAAVLLGYGFGLGLLGFGVFWLRISITQFGGVSPPLGFALTFLFVLVVALYFALVAWLAWYLGRHRGDILFMTLVAPVTWLAVELVRAYLFTGFPWLSVGYSQIDLPLAGYAPVAGVLGVGFLLALSAGLLALWRRAWALPLLLGLWGAGYLLGLVSWTQPSGNSIPVAVVQGNIVQEQKWLPRMFEPTLDLYRALSGKAPDARVLVWPETAIPAFDDRVEGSVLLPLHLQMLGEQRDLLTGIVSRTPDGRYFNAMIALGVSGRQAYFKRHLVPFGEYMPFAAILDPILDFLSIPMSDFSADNGDPEPVKLGGHWAGVDICYEDAFGNEVAATLPRAEFLINASNDAWFGDSLAPHQHLQIARMRALETERYLLRATNTGISAVISPRGKIVDQAQQFQQAVLTAEITPLQGRTPYALWLDLPVALFALLSLSGLWVGRKRGTAAYSE